MMTFTLVCGVSNRTRKQLVWICVDMGDGKQLRFLTDKSLDMFLKRQVGMNKKDRVEFFRVLDVFGKAEIAA